MWENSLPKVPESGIVVDKSIVIQKRICIFEIDAGVGGTFLSRSCVVDLEDPFLDYYKQICEMFYENEKNSPQIYADSVTLINAGKQSEFSYQFSVLLLGRSLIAEN